MANLYNYFTLSFRVFFLLYFSVSSGLFPPDIHAVNYFRACGSLSFLVTWQPGRNECACVCSSDSKGHGQIRRHRIQRFPDATAAECCIIQRLHPAHLQVEQLELSVHSFASSRYLFSSFGRPVLAALLHQLQVLRGFEMLLLVYSSKPTSWQPDRSLQQHRAPSHIYAAFPVFFFCTSFTLSPHIFILLSGTSLYCLLSLSGSPECGNSCNLAYFSSPFWPNLPSSPHYYSSSCSRKNILAGFGLDIQRCIHWILRQPVLRLPVVSHYSGFIPASLLNNIHKTLLSLFFTTHHSCTDKTALLHVRIYSKRYVVIYLLHSNVGAVRTGKLFINLIISLEILMPKCLLKWAFTVCLQIVGIIKYHNIQDISHNIKKQNSCLILHQRGSTGCILIYYSAAAFCWHFFFHIFLHYFLCG